MRISSNRPSRGVGSTPLRGVGNEFYPINGSWLTISGKAGEIAYVSISQILRDAIEVGIYVQSSASASVAYTLDHPATAIAPQSAADANWSTDQSLTAAAIEETEAAIFTAARITFTEDGFVTFYAM